MTVLEAGAWSLAVIAIATLAGGAYKYVFRRSSFVRCAIRRLIIVTEVIAGRDADPERGIPGIPGIGQRFAGIDQRLDAVDKTLKNGMSSKLTRIQELAEGASEQAAAVDSRNSRLAVNQADLEAAVADALDKLGERIDLLSQRTREQTDTAAEGVNPRLYARFIDLMAELLREQAEQADDEGTQGET